ncbi:MAG TPA: hypothetical protein VNN15_02280 [Solirubrobacterales bacterium]|nr:hypothetical protein [Solirubrobacterales bacterium]
MSFRVRRMREVHPAALKHGVEPADIKHALRHALRFIDKNDGTYLYLGPARNGQLLEVVTAFKPDQSEIAIHAMRMRRKYANLLPRD